MSEFYWAKKVGKTPEELLIKLEKVKGITSKVIRKSSLLRSIDAREIPKEIDKGNLPRNIFDIYKEGFFTSPREFGYISLYNNHVGILREKDLNLGTKLTAKLKAEFEEEWTYALIKDLQDFPPGYIGIPMPSS